MKKAVYLITSSAYGETDNVGTFTDWNKAVKALKAYAEQYEWNYRTKRVEQLYDDIIKFENGGDIRIRTLWLYSKLSEFKTVYGLK